MGRNDIIAENGFMLAGYYLTLAITELNNAMRMAGHSADAINDVNRKYDVLWKAYREAYETRRKNTNDEA